MTYNKLFPVSLTYLTDLVPEKFESEVYSDNSLKCAIQELGACEAYMYLKSPGSEQFWLGHSIIDTVKVLIVGWDRDNWLINYNDEIYHLPFIHFMELKTIKAAPFN